MATRQVNWLRGQKKFDFTGLTPSQISARKDKIKEKALVKINRRLRALGQFKLKSIKWTKDRSKPLYFLLVYLTPPARSIRLHPEGGSGSGSKITPTPPTVP